MLSQGRRPPRNAVDLDFLAAAGLESHFQARSWERRRYEIHSFFHSSRHLTFES
jgi:hypothetical protein